jgi:hypothetical protein
MAALPWKGEAVADTLDQDVQALKKWLRSAWRYLADPSTSRFERQELRNYMKEANAALRAGLQKAAVRDKALKEGHGDYSLADVPDFRILKIEKCTTSSAGVLPPEH